MTNKVNMHDVSPGSTLPSYKLIMAYISPIDIPFEYSCWGPRRVILQTFKLYITFKFQKTVSLGGFLKGQCSIVSVK
jgi:hypothetical protein